MLKLKQVQELQDWLGTVDLQEGALGQPMYLDADLREIKNDVLRLDMQPASLDGMVGVVDKQTEKAIEKMLNGAKSIQTEANTVWDTFSDFATMGPIKIVDIHGSDEEIKAQFAEQHEVYAEHVYELTKQSMMFSEIAYNFTATADILKLQIKLADKEDLFSQNTRPQSIQRLLKQQEKFVAKVKKIRARNKQAMTFMRKFGEIDFIEKRKGTGSPRTVTGQLTKNYSAVDPLYFEISIAYLDYVHEVYALEAQAREIESTITQINAATDSNFIEVYNDIEMLKKAQSYVSGSRGADLLRGGKDLVGRVASTARDTKTAEMTSGLFGKAIDAPRKPAGVLLDQLKDSAALYAEEAPGKDFIRERAQRMSSSMSKLLAKFTADLEDTNDRLSTAYIKINVEARNAGGPTWAYQEPKEIKSRQTARSNIQLANRALARALRNAY
tara:strand:+ start:12231 stop:13556 length:1326 start_codon:yes stop_codon:yes gene_type:complete